jgi:hypothetical protein
MVSPQPLILSPRRERPQKSTKITDGKRHRQRPGKNILAPKYGHHSRHHGPIHERRKHKSLRVQSSADDVEQPQPGNQQAHQT